MESFYRGVEDFNIGVEPMTEDECLELGYDYFTYISGYQSDDSHEELFFFNWEEIIHD